MRRNLSGQINLLRDEHLQVVSEFICLFFLTLGSSIRKNFASLYSICIVYYVYPTYRCSILIAKGSARSSKVLPMHQSMWCNLESYIVYLILCF